MLKYIYIHIIEGAFFELILCGKTHELYMYMYIKKINFLEMIVSILCVATIGEGIGPDMFILV